MFSSSTEGKPRNISCIDLFTVASEHGDGLVVTKCCDSHTLYDSFYYIRLRDRQLSKSSVLELRNF